MKAVDTERQATELKILGMSNARIAEQLGLTEEGARVALHRSLDRAIDESKDVGERYRQLLIARVEKDIEWLVPMASRGDPASIRVHLQATDLQAKLLGLYVQKHEHTGKDGKPIEVTQTYLDIVRSAEEK